jgi:hypothetical protein
MFKSGATLQKELDAERLRNGGVDDFTARMRAKSGVRVKSEKELLKETLDIEEAKFVQRKRLFEKAAMEFANTATSFYRARLDEMADKLTVQRGVAFDARMRFLNCKGE